MSGSLFGRSVGFYLVVAYVGRTAGRVYLGHLYAKSLMRLFLIFLIVPLLEIALFIQVGGWIGLWPTLATVVITALIGTMLVRSQGAAVIQQLRERIDDLRDPTEPIAHGAMILFSGALLLTPGFFTDAVGFALLIPGVRARIYRFIKERVVIEQRTPASRENDPTIIDAEFVDLEPPSRDAPSGWTRH